MRADVGPASGVGRGQVDRNRCDALSITGRREVTRSANPRRRCRPGRGGARSSPPAPATIQARRRDSRASTHTATTLVGHLRSDRPIREALVALLRSSDTFGEHADAATIRAGIDAGRYVFLIDSLDEVPRRHDREALVAALGTLTGASPRVILTTRPSAHTAVELPEGFARVDIAPLDVATQERLARAWATSWAPTEDVQQILCAVATVRDNFPATTDERSPVENPLLLGCILQVFATYHRLPDDTAKLYADMVRVLCEAKIRAADDAQRDTIVERYRVALRQLALASQEHGGTRLELGEAKALLVATHFSSRERVENELQTLANHTGLIRYESGGDRVYVRPWHRSYQEYLAAEMIAVDYANRAAEVVGWLRAPRGDRGARLHDASWRGTLRFLVGAAAHYDPGWGVRLLEALADAASAGGPDRARLFALAVEGAAEYAGSLFANEPIRKALPQAVIAAFAHDGETWPIDARIDVLDALGRLGDPRLSDPRTTVEPGWVAVQPGSYATGGRPLAPRKPSSSRSRKRKRRVDVDAVLPREVHLSPGFWIRRWPITVAEFLPFVEDVASGSWSLARRSAEESQHRTFSPAVWRVQARHPTRPVVEVDWQTARDFCAWAQARWRLPADGVIDLPTSAEWEIAARRRTDRKYAWGDDPPGARDNAAASYAWTGARHVREGATPVGAFPRGHSPEGLWDLIGNVAEWCATRYESDHDQDVPIDEDLDHGLGGLIYRGGSWRHNDGVLRLMRRGQQQPSAATNWIGFRVVLRAREAR